jgi:hypothetical protein
MAAKVINFHSPDGKNTYELTFTRESAEATERNGFQIYEFSNGINPVKNTKTLFYGAFIARNKGIKRNAVDDMLDHIEDKEGLIAALMEMYANSIKALIATDEEDKTAKNATWEIV